ATVAMQLREYEGMVRRDAAADRSHVEALLRLVGRRPDADLVFADAGRRAARRAVRRLFVLTRLAARAGPRALAYVAARRAARAGPTAGCCTTSANSTRSPLASSETPGWERGACSSCCRARAVRSR